MANEQKEVEALEAQFKLLDNGQKLMKEFVTSEDIAEIVSKWTGIPVQSMLQSEKGKVVEFRG